MCLQSIPGTPYPGARASSHAVRRQDASPAAILASPRSRGAVLTNNERLDSWKEIAAYLKRGVRTVQRWERVAGLPVRRVELDKHGTVYAYKAELAAWW